MRPPAITASRSDMVRASSWSWVTYTKVIPIASWRALSSTWRALRSLASRAPSGSSSSSTDGLRTSALASATRCCWPPDSWAGRQLGRPAPLQALELDEGKGLGDPPLGLALVDVLEPQPEGDVVGHVEEREQGVALEDGVDLALVGRGAGHVGPVEQDAAVGGLLEPGDQSQGGRLAAARGAEQGEELAPWHLQVDAVHGGDVLEPLDQPDQPDLASAHAATPFSESTTLRRWHRKRPSSAAGRLARSAAGSRTGSRPPARPQPHRLRSFTTI